MPRPPDHLRRPPVCQHSVQQLLIGFIFNIQRVDGVRCMNVQVICSPDELFMDRFEEQYQ